jgi:hypothetical protein
MGAWSEPTYSLTLDVTGIRFYGSDARIILAEAALSIESNVQILSSEILKPQITISGEVDVSVTTFKTAKAAASIDGGSVAVTVGTEIVKALIAPSASVSLSVSGTKIAFASSTNSVESDTTATAIEILLGTTSVSGESNLTATALEIAFASSSIDVESNSTTTALEILFASSTSSIESQVTTSALEILFASTSIESNSDLQATSYKFAFSQSEVSGELVASITAYEILFASIDIQSEANVQTRAIEILFANTQVSGLVINVTVGKEILFINPQPTGAATVLNVSAIRFSNNIVEDTQNIRPLLIIDNKPITEHNRGTTVTVNQSFIESQNWRAKRSRYYKTGSPRKSFSINWSNLPSARTQTADTKFGRDAIREIAADPDIHVLKFLDIDSDGTTPYTETEYNVIVKNYSENLIRRDVDTDLYLWDCSLELEEV